MAFDGGYREGTKVLFILGRGLLTLVLVLVQSFFSPCWAEEGKAGFSDLQKKFRKAFKPLRVSTTSRLEKQVVPALPKGVVTNSGPFDALIKRLLEPYGPKQALREEVMRGLAGFASTPAGKSVKKALKVIAKENRDLAKQAAWVEENYAGVYDKGYMDAGEKERQARKLAAVLIPFFNGLQARNSVVVELAADALSGMKEGEGFDWLAGKAVTDAEDLLRIVAVQALGRIGGDGAKDALAKAVKGDSKAAVRTKALNALMSWPLKEVKGTVIEALEDPAWEVRALAVAICACGKLVEAAGPLIKALAKEDGRLRKDIDDALFALLGVRYYGDAALWKKWMEANKEKVEEKARHFEEKGEYDKPLGKVELAKGTSAQAGGKEKKKATSSFYGIATFSKRMIFIIDISRSMMSPAGAAVPEATGSGGAPYSKPEGSNKIDIAKWQLHRAVHALPKDAVFNIIVYSESYKVWGEGMMKATARGKAAAHGFIDSLNPNGTTNIYDSLVKGFEIAGAAPPGVVKTGKKRKELEADTIFLLSDGNPNRGRITEPEKILTDIRKRNPGIVIHAIGIGEAAGSPLMKRLAGENGGRYVGFK